MSSAKLDRLILSVVFTALAVNIWLVSSPYIVTSLILLALATLAMASAFIDFKESEVARRRALAISKYFSGGLIVGIILLVVFLSVIFLGVE